jgi:hypothetical protein
MEQQSETIYKLSEEVIQKMEEYYKLKSDYETKAKAYKDKSKPPKCIFCKRSGGTIFKTEVIQGDRILLAYCNVKPDPCKIKIDIHTGKIELYIEKMREYEYKIKELKKSVILYKNDLLFGYISSTKIAERFNNIKKQIDEYTLDYYFIKENYELFVDNIEDYIRLCDLEKKSYLEIEEIRVELTKYKYTKDDEIKDEIIEDREISPNSFYYHGFHQGDFYFSPDFRMYPFDQQKLHISIENTLLPETDFIILADDESYSRSNQQPHLKGLSSDLINQERESFSVLKSEILSGVGFYNTATNAQCVFKLPVTMRTNPTLVATTGTGYYQLTAGGVDDLFNSLTIFNVSTESVQLYNNTEASGTIGYAGMMKTVNASASAAFSAEL